MNLRVVVGVVSVCAESTPWHGVELMENIPLTLTSTLITAGSPLVGLSQRCEKAGVRRAFWTCGSLTASIFTPLGSEKRT